MGTCNFKSDGEDTSISLLRSHFCFEYCIGKGGFGKVWKTQLLKTKEPFAVKEMAKARVLLKKSVQSVTNERKILSQLRHPFIVNMHFAFQDKENLYLVMDLLTGGDLRHHFGRHKALTEDQTKFIVGCILVALQHLHAHGVLHRDVKPENLVLDSVGYVRLTDFGIARVWTTANANETSGTPGYMAPEVMCRQDHGVAVDYFALGVIVYECIFGKRPYAGRSRRAIREQILSKQAQIHPEELPSGWSVQAAHFTNALLQRKPADRLGEGGPAQVKGHPWLEGFAWELLLKKELPAPFAPVVCEDNSNLQVDGQWKDAESAELQQLTASLRRNSVQSLFAGYAFDIKERLKNQA